MNKAGNLLMGIDVGHVSRKAHFCEFALNAFRIIE